MLFGLSDGTYSGVDAVSLADLILQLTLRGGRDPVLWVERGENIRNNGPAYAPIEGRSNLGVVTIERRSMSVTHEFCVVTDFQGAGVRFAPLFAAFPTLASCVRSRTFRL
jgi:hypothetical protein